MEDIHVLHVTRDPDVGGGQGLVMLDVESDAGLTGCPDCYADWLKEQRAEATVSVECAALDPFPRVSQRDP